jgi:hypothetical protein
VQLLLQRGKTFTNYAVNWAIANKRLDIVMLLEKHGEQMLR